MPGEFHGKHPFFAYAGYPLPWLQPRYMHALTPALANEASPVFVCRAYGLALEKCVHRAVPFFLGSSPCPFFAHTQISTGSHRTAHIK
jgi:hypothetical protein